MFLSLSHINVLLDQQIDVFIEKWLLEGFGDFFRDLMTSCGNEPDAGNIPIEVRHYTFKGLKCFLHFYYILNNEFKFFNLNICF